MTKVWLRGDFLLNSQLPVCPPHRIVPFNLSKMVAYAKSKGSSGYPDISYDCWFYVARNKIQVRSELADLYFRVAWESWNLISGLDNSTVEPDPKKSQMKVPLLPFAIFLFMQQSNRISLRASMTGVEKRPRAYSERETSSCRGRRSSLGGSGGQENIELKAMEFVLANLKPLLELAIIYEGAVEDYHIPSSKRDVLTLHSLVAFDLIFEGIQLMQPMSVIPFSAIIRNELGQEDDSINRHSLEDFIRTHLQVDPFVVASSLYDSPRSVVNAGSAFAGIRLERSNSENGVPSDFPVESPNDSIMGIETKVGPRIVHNAKSAPKSHRLVVVNYVHRQTLAKSNDVISHSVLHIGMCCGSHLYFLSPFKMVAIRRCRGTTFILGPTGNAVRLHNCQDCTVVVMCKRLIVTDCQRCTFYVKTPTNPVIFGSANSELTFAPFCSWYEDLEIHMASVGITSRPDRWNEPIVFTNCEQKPASTGSSVTCWRLMAPADFYPIAIPFRTSGATKKIPGGLPVAYKRALEARSACFNEWNEFTDTLQEEERKRVKELVNKEFSAWLVNTGHIDQLDQLKTLETKQRRRLPK